MDVKLVRSDQTQSTSKLKLRIIIYHWLTQLINESRMRLCYILMCRVCTSIQWCGLYAAPLSQFILFYCYWFEPSNFRRLRNQTSLYYPNSSYIKWYWTKIESIPFVSLYWMIRQRIRLPLQPGKYGPPDSVDNHHNADWDYVIYYIGVILVSSLFLESPSKSYFM